MRRSLCVLCVSFALASSALARDDSFARSYAVAMVVAHEAEKNCPGIKMDGGYMILYRARAGLTDDATDDRWLSTQFDEIKPKVEAQIASRGPVDWCRQAWTAFGPSGVRALRR